MSGWRPRAGSAGARNTSPSGPCGIPSPGLHAALTKLTGSETVSTEIAVSRTQVLAVECADGTRYYSDGQQVERFIAGENPDGTVRYGYGTEEQYGHDFKKG